MIVMSFALILATHEPDLHIAPYNLNIQKGVIAFHGSTPEKSFYFCPEKEKTKNPISQRKYTYVHVPSCWAEIVQESNFVGALTSSIFRDIKDTILKSPGEKERDTLDKASPPKTQNVC
jgi:hypothetical protein